MSRKVAREVALKIVFARLLGGESNYDYVIEQADTKIKATADDVSFANEIISGISNNLDMLNNMISSHAIGWALDRMPKIDLCILHIALYEMIYRPDIPHSVSINEAVELAKKFSNDKSPTFINGILGTLSKQLEETKTDATQN